ncbi:MAG: chain length-determining protein [Burkholderiales bacterium]|nr:chain length-determining protein [Burkholderiales bacterium]
MEQLIAQIVTIAKGMWRFRWPSLAVAWLVAVVGMIIVFRVPDNYEATARVYVDTQSILKPLMSGLAVQPNVEQQVVMLSRTLISRPNMEKLVRMADLDLEAKTPQQRDAVIDGLMSSIKVQGRAKDNLYTITYRSSQPAKAKRVVDSLLSIFVESGLGNKRRDTEKAQQFIDEQIREYERRLQEAERRLKDFKLTNLNGLAGGQDAISTMVAMEDQISRARMDLRAAEQSRDTLKRELAGEEPVFLPDPNWSAPSMSNESISTELDQRIEALKRNLDELLRKYTEQHPDVTGTRRVLAELEAQRQERLEALRKAIAEDKSEGARAMPGVERNPVYQQLKLSLAEAEANTAALRGRLVELETRYEQVRSTARLRPELEEQLVQLNRDYQVQKSQYDSLLARRESASMTSELEQSASIADFRVIDPPRVSPKPVAPNRLLLLPAALVVSLGAGVFSAFLYGQVFPTFHSARGLRRTTQRPVLGALTLQETPLAKRKNRMRSFAFTSALAGLVGLFGSAWVVLLLMSRTA